VLVPFSNLTTKVVIACGASRCSSCWRSSLSSRALSRGHGPSTGRSCVRSRSTVRIRTPAASTAESTSPLRRARRCWRPSAAPSRSPARCLGADRRSRFASATTPSRSCTSALLPYRVEHRSARVPSSEPSVRTATSISACAWRPIRRGTSTRCSSCRRGSLSPLRRPPLPSPHRFPRLRLRILLHRRRTSPLRHRQTGRQRHLRPTGLRRHPNPRTLRRRPRCPSQRSRILRRRPTLRPLRLRMYRPWRPTVRLRPRPTLLRRWRRRPFLTRLRPTSRPPTHRPRPPQVPPLRPTQLRRSRLRPRVLRRCRSPWSRPHPRPSSSCLRWQTRIQVIRPRTSLTSRPVRPLWLRRPKRPSLAWLPGPRPFRCQPIPCRLRGSRAGRYRRALIRSQGFSTAGSFNSSFRSLRNRRARSTPVWRRSLTWRVPSPQRAICGCASAALGSTSWPRRRLLSLQHTSVASRPRLISTTRS
jgi:hypothetical protein